MAVGALMGVAAPERLETARLLLRRPRAGDADVIFLRYSSNREVTRYVGWAVHNSVDDTIGFLRYSDAEWERSPAGPYLAFSRADSTLLGGTGLAFETPFRAATGYVFARDAWGQGYATEALAAMVEVARATAVRRLYALCHADHRASAHVLEKCGFACEGRLRSHAEFPNLEAGAPQDVLCYSTILEISSGTPPTI
jgi:[ribosomal protein S5]-alanine N-acetyltransferase